MILAIRAIWQHDFLILPKSAEFNWLSWIRDLKITENQASIRASIYHYKVCNLLFFFFIIPGRAKIKIYQMWRQYHTLCSTRYRHVQIFENYVLVTTLIDTCMNKEYKQYWIDFIQCISFSFALTVRPIFSSILMSSS